MKFRTKAFNSLVAVLLAVIGLSLTACGDDDQDEPEVPDTWTTAYVVDLTFSPDFMEVADITAHIANPDGTYSEEKVLNATTKWTIKGNKVPEKAGVLLTFVPKDNIDPDRIYNLNIAGAKKCASYKNGKEYAALSTGLGFGGNLPVKGDRVAQYLTKRYVDALYGINDEGSIENLEMKDFDFGLNGVWEWLAGVLVGEEQ